MSIVLRAEAQHILDHHGLANYHLEIGTNSPIIASECGKHLVIIDGVTYSKVPPSNKEVLLSLPLIDAFIVKHIFKIKNLIEAKKGEKI